MRLARISALITVAMLGSSCDVWPFGPSKSAAGIWSARDCTPGSCRIYELILTQEDDLISGVACGGEDGFQPVRDMAVSGGYPNVRFTLRYTDSVLGQFFGKFEADRDQIAGDLRSRHLRFNRTDTDGRCTWPVLFR